MEMVIFFGYLIDLRVDQLSSNIINMFHAKVHRMVAEGGASFDDILKEKKQLTKQFLAGAENFFDAVFVYSEGKEYNIENLEVLFDKFQAKEMAKPVEKEEEEASPPVNKTPILRGSTKKFFERMNTD